MNPIYLLPCHCGRKIQVQARHAGVIVTCDCGASLEVPTLLGLRALEQVEVQVQPKTPKTAWSTGHRIIFLGLIVILAAVVVGVWLFTARPTDPYANFTPEQMREATEKLTPVQSWRLWQMLDKSKLDGRKRPAELFFADQQAQYRVYWWLLALIAGTGLVLIAAGIIVVNLRKKRRL